jgi:hypothetical protein
MPDIVFCNPIERPSNIEHIEKAVMIIRPLINFIMRGSLSVISFLFFSSVSEMQFLGIFEIRNKSLSDEAFKVGSVGKSEP